MTEATELHVVQRAMHALLRGEASAGAVAAELGVVERRLKIYRDFVFEHVAGTLAKLYPHCRALLGEVNWGPLVREFFREVPPTSWELNASGEPFARFLDGRVGEGGVCAAHVALAQYEWEEFAAYLHPADVVAPAADEPAIVNPTLCILELAYDVVPWLVARSEGAPVTPDTALPEPLDKPRLVLVFRKAESFNIGFYQGSDDLLFALKVVHEGLSFDDAVAGSGSAPAQVQAALDRAREIGLVLGNFSTPRD